MSVFECEYTIYIHLNIFLDSSKFPIDIPTYWQTKSWTQGEYFCDRLKQPYLAEKISDSIWTVVKLDESDLENLRSHK